jgi:hypothetical protein
VQYLLKAFLAWRAWAVIAPYKLGIGIAFLATVITQTAHSEFIEYLQVQASVGTNGSSLDNVKEILQLAYLAKWSSLSLIALALLLYVWRIGRLPQGSDDRAFDFLRDVGSPARETRSSPNQAGLEPSKSGQQASGQQTVKGETESADGGEVTQERDNEDKAFDFLRERPRLRKRGEMILDRESSRD